MSTEACTFSIEWGRADEVWLMCGYGEVYRGGTVGKIAGPIVLSISGNPGVDPRSVGDDPGSYLVAFYDDGDLIDLEGGALPPLEVPGDLE